MSHALISRGYWLDTDWALQCRATCPSACVRGEVGATDHTRIPCAPHGLTSHPYGGGLIEWQVLKGWSCGYQP
jgi:hypothetical protein